MKIRILFKGVGRFENHLLAERLCQYLKTYRQSTAGETARYGYSRDTRHVCRNSIDVRKVHTKRIVRLLSDFKCRCRGCRGDYKIATSKCLIEVLFDLR